MVDEIPVDSVGGDLLGGGSVEASGGGIAVAAFGGPLAVSFGKGHAVAASGESPAVASKTTEETHAHKKTRIFELTRIYITNNDSNLTNTILVGEQSTAAYLKYKVSKRHKVPLEKLTLFWKGRVLKDHEVLKKSDKRQEPSTLDRQQENNSSSRAKGTFYNANGGPPESFGQGL